MKFCCSIGQPKGWNMRPLGLTEDLVKFYMLIRKLLQEPGQAAATIFACGAFTTTALGLALAEHAKHDASIDGNKQKSLDTKELWGPCAQTM